MGSANAQQSGTIESGQFNLEYLIEGAGTPAIVIGFPNYYSRVFSTNLRSQLRVVFVDHRGSASSPGAVPLSEYSLEQISDDIELVRTELGLGPVVIIGHSGHALMALEYGKRYPESVSHVVMIGIAPDFSDESESEAEKYWEKLATAERKAALDRNWEGVPEEAPEDSYPGENFVKTYVRNGPMAWYDHDFDSTPLWKDVDVNLEMISHVWGTLLAEIDITKGLDAFHRPVFLALGKYDFLVAPPSSWNRIESKFNDLTIRVFDESGHTPQYEQSELFDSRLLNWLHDSASD
jgi:proline iminopeptidase